MVRRLRGRKPCELPGAGGLPGGTEGARRQPPESSPAYGDMVHLVHSISRGVVRHAAYYAGTDRNAPSELPVPSALCFVTFAAPRGDFVLGGLADLFEHDVDTLLDWEVLFDGGTEAGCEYIRSLL